MMEFVTLLMLCYAVKWWGKNDLLAADSFNTSVTSAMHMGGPQNVNYMVQIMLYFFSTYLFCFGRVVTFFHLEKQGTTHSSVRHTMVTGMRQPTTTMLQYITFVAKEPIVWINLI